MSRRVLFVLVDGWADWEPGRAFAELRRTFGFETLTASAGGREAVSIGGLVARPAVVLEQVETPDVLILPGSDVWVEGGAPDVDALMAATLKAGGVVGAICGATLAPARAGLLDSRRHTSNAAAFLAEHAPAYVGGSHYVEAQAVGDGGVVTASGYHPDAFALELFKAAAPERIEDIRAYGRIIAPGHAL